MKRFAARPGLWSFALLWALISSIQPALADDAITLDPALKGYIKVSGVSGNVNSIGLKDFANNTPASKSRSKARAQAQLLRP